MTTLAKRREAAAKHRPKQVRLLLVAEAPPCTPDRYFYFEHVDRHDWLFRYVWEGLARSKPDRERKAEHLAALRNAGVFLIDLHEEPVSQPSLAVLRTKVAGLTDRCREIRPKSVALIKHSVYDAAHEALAAAGLPVIDERIPFPSSGQQKVFLRKFRRAMDAAGLEPISAIS